MIERNDTARLKQELAALRNAIRERHAAEESIARKYGKWGSHSTKALAGAQRELDQHRLADFEAVEERFQETQQATEATFDREFQALHRSWQAALGELESQFERENEALEKEMIDARWMVTSVLDEEFEQSQERELKSFTAEIAATGEQLDTQSAEADRSFEESVATMQRWRQWRSFTPMPVDNPPSNQTQAATLFESAYQRSQQQAARLRGLWLPRMFAGVMPALLTLILWLPMFTGVFLFATPVARSLGFTPMTLLWGVTAGASTLLAALLIALILWEITRTKTGGIFEDILQAAEERRFALDRWKSCSQAEVSKRERQHEKRRQSYLKEREKSLTRIEGIESNRRMEFTQRYEATVQEKNQKYSALIDGITQTRDHELQTAEVQRQAAVTELTARYDRELATVTQELTEERDAKAVEENRERLTMAERWTAAVNRFADFTDRQNRRCRATTPSWESYRDDDWSLPEEMPDVIRFGHFDCDLQKIPDGLSVNRRLWPERTQFDLPAVLSFPNHASLLLKTRGEGRSAATDVMRNVMLRLLTSLPRGKVRFTVIDPVGMGEPFSAFMHLADYDELMIGSRIWTDSAQIEKQLAELSEHMENIFQSYLRNEFETIDEYNRHAGEVAEPYQVLVVANFPVNISEIAARRLANIVASGARCGVLTLISVDTSQPLPHHFNLADLEANAFTAEWKNDRFVACDPELAALPLTLDDAPPAKDFTQIVKTAGRLSKDARRVEVSFDRIAPSPDEVWSSHSNAGIDIPLGRAGATKLQSLRLGRGTSQHVLIVGKTGSGKSSFLHALITNLSLHYSPDEIEFYLIDFKKGVEFKTYATHALPHARVIGIESDREFGVSVLQRLDEIMQERGDLFRACGVQDIEQFRAARPDYRLPRIMLIVDEFQEFFVEDDSLSHTASQLLDRLVRQGRAFGMHVLLGSQTLGGAYSLPRSTIGQFAVRIALQCSENDAHLILSEDNTAARLLTRPGEAIYNDANGLMEGNHPFQIAWLPDTQRETKLLQIRERTGSRYVDLNPPVVFEGNVASNLSQNRQLANRIETFGENPDAAAPSTVLAWLGESVSIKPAAQIAFVNRPGDNLLIVGPEAESAHGIMTAALLSIAAQLPASFPEESGASFLLLNDETAETAGAWSRISELIPQSVRRVGTSNAVATIRDLHEEIQRRHDNRDASHPPLFLFVSDLARFRDLKNERDEFDFSSMGDAKPAGAGELLAEIFRDGPAVGVHAIVWCDTYANLSRWCRQSTLREFELRVVFRMNSTDSSHLIDSSAATRLGSYRALLYRSESGTLEKFRPYGIPADPWLTWADDQFHGRDSAYEEWTSLDTLTVV